ncbi:hypothetical protein M1B34_31520, partial [Pseudomonas sp. MAFF 302030]
LASDSDFKAAIAGKPGSYKGMRGALRGTISVRGDAFCRLGVAQTHVGDLRYRYYGIPSYAQTLLPYMEPAHEF